MKAIQALWAYFKDMNSERGGGVSIKRNVAWGIGTLMVFVQVFGLVALYYLIVKHDGQETLVTVFKYALTLFTITNALMILLVLGITSIEKISVLAKNVLPGRQLPDFQHTPPPPDAPPAVPTLS